MSGNHVGTDAEGDGGLGNTNSGVLLQDAPGNTIGGTQTGEPNVIAFNSVDGVTLTGDGSTGNAILTNSIHSNGELGIDLDNDGVTQNDEDDPDTGPNNLQNFPALEQAVTSPAGAVVTGTLNSTPTTAFRVQFFSSPEADPSGFGEGETFLGQQTVTTDANGDAPIAFTAANVSEGEFVTATATRQDASATPDTDTSEFSNAVQVAAVADLAIDKSAPGTATEEEEFDYNITLTNNGPSDAEGVTVTDTLPSEVRFVEQGTDGRCAFAANDPNDPDDDTVSCQLGTLEATPPSNTAAITIRVKATTPSEARNTATVSSDAADPNDTNDTDQASTTINAPPDTTKPAITDLTPPPGSTTNKNGRDIEATIQDDRSVLEKENIRLLLDGQQRSRFTYEPQSGRLVFDKMERLGSGKHKVRIETTDEAGNTAKEKWTFTIR